MTRVFTFSLLFLLCWSTADSHGQGESSNRIAQSSAKLFDQYLDQRMEAAPTATSTLIEEAKKFGIEGAEDFESALRNARAEYPDPSKWIGEYSIHEVECYHVDYASKFVMFVPLNYDAKKTYSLVVVGHGGNSSMSAARAMSVAEQYIGLYAPQVTQNMDAIVVAPASERGWGNIGYSLAFSTISKVKRMFPIDPDRVYLTGQSMGGHLTYRMALTYPDHWGAVSPHSGGYDYVEKKSIANLMNVPGISVFGSREPYGINGDNKTNEVWAKQHGMDWKFIEKNGGHTIYRDELPGMSKFFQENPRDLYRDTVVFRHGGLMKFVKPWDIKGWPKHTVYSDNRPMRWNRKHWIEVQPREDSKEPQELIAKNLGNNQIEIVTNNVRQLAVYLHPKMVDFSKPVSITVNGKMLHTDKVEADIELMLNKVRESNDRGKVFWAKVELEIQSDQEVVIPEVDQ